VHNYSYKPGTVVKNKPLLNWLIVIFSNALDITVMQCLQYTLS